MKSFELVGHTEPKPLVSIQGAPALDPIQGFARLSWCKQLRDNQAVLRFEPGLFSEPYVCLDVPLRAVDRAKNYAAVPVRPTGRVRRGSLETLANLLFESSQPCFVEGRGSIFLDFMAESVGIVVHPRQKRRSGFVRFGAGGLTSFDPEADEFMRESPEAAVRIIQFIC